MYVTARVEGNNGDGENLSGFVIEVAGGKLSEPEEVTRVAFARQFSSNPDVGFEDQADIEINKAKFAVEKINELFVASGQLQ